MRKGDLFHSLSNNNNYILKYIVKKKRKEMDAEGKGSSTFLFLSFSSSK